MSQPSYVVLGEAICLLTAFLWAVSVIVFRRPIERFGARSVNLTKCLIAAALQGLTVWWIGQASALWTAPPRELLYLAISGLIGLSIGDTALFGAVARIGPHRTLLLQTLAPVFTALLAALWQGESTTSTQAMGAVLILLGVAIVVTPPGAAGRDRSRVGWDLAGVALGLLAALGQGTGLVLAKAGMATVPVMPASFVRLGVAAAGLSLLGLVGGRLGRLPDILRSRWALSRIVPATLMGSYVALFLLMAGIALAPASIAAVLLSTGPIFSLFLEAWQERRPISVRGLIGTLLAIAGVAWLSWGQQP